MAGRKIAIVASCARFAGTIVIQVATTVTNFGITRWKSFAIASSREPGTGRVIRRMNSRSAQTGVAQRTQIQTPKMAMAGKAFCTQNFFW